MIIDGGVVATVSLEVNVSVRVCVGMVRVLETVSVDDNVSVRDFVGMVCVLDTVSVEVNVSESVCVGMVRVSDKLSEIEAVSVRALDFVFNSTMPYAKGLLLPQLQPMLLEDPVEAFLLEPAPNAFAPVPLYNTVWPADAVRLVFTSFASESTNMFPAVPVTDTDVLDAEATEVPAVELLATPGVVPVVSTFAQTDVPSAPSTVLVPENVSQTNSVVDPYELRSTVNISDLAIGLVEEDLE